MNDQSKPGLILIIKWLIEFQMIIWRRWRRS